MFFEEGEPLLDGEPGDLKFHVKTRPHPKFERDRSDLKYNLTISLLDALVGFSTEVRCNRAIPADVLHYSMYDVCMLTSRHVLYVLTSDPCPWHWVSLCIPCPVVP